MKWNEVLQKYFKLSKTIETEYVHRKYTIKDNPITIKGHNYEKDLKQHTDFELNDVKKVYLITKDNVYIRSSWNPVYIVKVWSSVEDVCTFEMLGDSAFNSWDLEVITEEENK